MQKFNIITSHSKYFKRLTSTFGKIFAGFAALWLILEVINYFTPENKISGYRFFGLISFIILSIMTGLIWELISLQRELIIAEAVKEQTQAQNEILQSQLQNPEKHNSDSSLLEELRLAYAQRNWEEVITLGSPLSRPLWLTGRYVLRHHIGSLVEGAAAFSNRFDIQASALIDDLGWTSIALRRYNEGINYLLHGLKVAEDNDLFALACRANRHLAGAYVKLGNIEYASRYTEKATFWLGKIDDEVERRELEAGLAYQRARELQLRGKFSEALPALISAQEMFIRQSDRDRANKVYGPIGQVYLALGKLSEAKDTFRRGLETARLSARRDCELVNLVGLADIAQRSGDRMPEAKKLLNEAAAIALHLGISDKAAELKEKANMLAQN